MHLWTRGKTCFKNRVQFIYNSLRRTRIGRAVVNICIARERSYRERVKEIESRLARELKGLDGTYLVRSGLFEGMRYPSYCFVWSEFIPKILGSYELEITTELERLCKQTAGNIIFVDVGAAEGHYAVGLPYRYPNAMSYAFEIQEEAHQVIRNLAIANGVESRVEIQREFSSETTLVCHEGDFVLFLVDIEGEEEKLCSIHFFKKNATATVIVEIHESVSPGLFDRIAARAKATHSPKVVFQNQSKYRIAMGLLDLDRFSADCVTDEKRPSRGNFWAIFSPRRDST
jgi:hypothetical protein